METINDRIRKIRESLGMTTEEFSVKLGVSRSSIEYVESGRNQPNVVFVAKLHQHFPQFSLEYILYGESSVHVLPEVKVKDSANLDVNRRKAEQLFQNAVKKAQFSSKKEEAGQAIADLKRGIAILESWMDDMDDEDFYLPNE